MNKPALQSLKIALLTVVGGSVLTWVLMGCPATGIDDADIFFVYARHLAEGHGFVYNIGGEHVEGFTSMLWTLVCACLFRLTHHVEIPLYVINLLIGVATVWVCLRRVKHPLVFLALLAAVPAWFAWCQVTLMETGLWCRLLTLAVLAVVERRTVLLVLLLPLLVITRPESMLWGVWLVLMFGVVAAKEEGWKKGLQAAVVPALFYACSLAGLIVFRLRYFGYPVPNTYYAKVSTNLLYDLYNGIAYLALYLISNPAVLLVMLTWGWVLVRGMRCWRSGFDGSMLIALCLLPGIGIPVLVGGDHFGGFRFYQPIWPLLCLLAADRLALLLDRFPPAKVRNALVALVLCGWILFPFTVRMKQEFRIAREGRETGAALATMFRDLDEYPTVATITAGGSKYTYPGTVLDLMGLNATEMAHAPGPRTGYKNHAAFNRKVFYAWQPDIILCGDSVKFDTMVLKGLPSDKAFKLLYCKGSLHRNGEVVTAYYLRNFLERIPGEQQPVAPDR